MIFKTTLSLLSFRCYEIKNKILINLLEMCCFKWVNLTSSYISNIGVNSTVQSLADTVCYTAYCYHNQLRYDLSHPN